MYQDIVILSLFASIYSTVAGAIERTWISGAIVFTAFGLLIGSAVVDHAIGLFNWVILVHAILSLTHIRMLPVFFALSGLNVSTEEKLVLGWFGPRGLASIVFAVVVVNANVPNSGPIAMTVVCTIILTLLMISGHPYRFHRHSFYGADGCHIGTCGSG